SRLRQPSHLHGQDAPVDLARSHPQGTAAWVPRADPGGARVDGRGLPLSAARRDAHDAGAAVGAQHLEDRPRRRRQRGGALLSRPGSSLRASVALAVLLAAALTAAAQTPAPRQLSPGLVTSVVGAALGEFDLVHGGFGRGGKPVPAPMLIL